MRKVYRNYISKVLWCLEEEEAEQSLFYLDEIEISDIFNKQKDQAEVYKFLNSRLSFISQYKNVSCTEAINKEDVIRGAQALNTARYYVTKGINHGSIEDVVKGTVILSYFEISFDHVINIEEFAEEDIQILSAKMTELLKEITIQINFTEEVPYGEKRYYEEYKRGVAEKNAHKVYSFMRALDRGIGYQLSGILRGIIKFTFLLNPQILKKVICKNTNPLTIMSIIEPLEDEEKLELCLEDDVDNGWALIGIIYQVLSHNRKKKHETIVLNQMTKVLNHLKYIDNDMFFQSIKLFKDYPAFNIILGRVLGQSKEEDIAQYTDMYIISDYRPPENNDELFIQNFYENSEEGKTLLLCSQIFKKWVKYLDETVKQGKYFKDLIHTNCIYIVAYYYILRKNNPKEFLLELEKVISEVRGVNYIWCNSSIEIRARYFQSLTYLCLLGIECENKTYRPYLGEDLREKLRLVLNDERSWIAYFASTEKPELLEEVQQKFELNGE